MVSQVIVQQEWWSDAQRSLCGCWVGDSKTYQQTWHLFYQ